MGLKIQLGKEIEVRFRKAAMKRFGYGKGALSKAAQEAILRWLSEVEKEDFEFKGDPVEAIDGLLRGVDLSSVELQHEAKRIWAWRSLEHVSHRH